VKYEDKENVTRKEWVSVENITSRTIEERNRREKSIDVFKKMEQKRRQQQISKVKLMLIY
jgi:hypothetical protein